MKKCSTAAVALALAVACPAHAGDACEFLPSAPDRHVVVPGDTLWGLAAVYLKNPWCWPQVWEMNREQIRDPHWIYPGQNIVLDRQLGRLSLAAAETRGATTPEQLALSPSARVELAAAAEPIPALDPKLLNLAGRVRLASSADAAGAARIIGFSESRRLAGVNDIALIEGERPAARMEVIRRLPPILDPDNGELLAIPLMRVGSARYLASDNPRLHRVLIDSASHELVAGDMLMTASRQPLPALLPRAAESVNGKVAAVLGESRWAAQRDLVALNRGSRDGLEAGSMVAVLAPVRISDDDFRRSPPSEKIAQLLVFLAQEHVALAIVMHSADAFGPGAAVRSVNADNGQR